MLIKCGDDYWSCGAIAVTNPYTYFNCQSLAKVVCSSPDIFIVDLQAMHISPYIWFLITLGSVTEESPSVDLTPYTDNNGLTHSLICQFPCDTFKKLIDSQCGYPGCDKTVKNRLSYWICNSCNHSTDPTIEIPKCQKHREKNGMGRILNWF
jgi:hypothetical protein